MADDMVSGDQVVDRTDELYSLDHLVTVDITLAPTDWGALRRQTRTIADILFGDCLKAPFVSPFTWFQGAVTIDGEFFDEVDVRKKGFIGSLSTSRPGLKLDLGEYVDGQNILGARHLTLNNSLQDESIIRQCLAYGVFAEAGIPAPRCNFATVSVNDEDLGVYVNVEPLKRAFIERHFDSADGNLYEGTLSDFDERLIVTFEPKFNEPEADGTDLQTVLDALREDDARLLEALDAVIDLDQFITFWAIEVILLHVDGYNGNRNNFYIYADPADGRFVFLPWGVDNILRNISVNQRLDEVAYQQSALARRLYAHPVAREMYFARLRELLDTVWDEEAILAEIDRMAGIVLPAIGDEELRMDVNAEISRLVQIVANRRTVLDLALAEDEPEPNDDPSDIGCLVEVGQVYAEFTTNWGSINQPIEGWFGEEANRVEVSYRGDEWDFSVVGVAAGNLDNNGARLNLYGVFEEDVFVTLTLPLDAHNLSPGATEVSGDLVYTDRSSGGEGESHHLGWVEAEVDFTSAEAASGAPLEGTIEGAIISWDETEE